MCGCNGDLGPWIFAFLLLLVLGSIVYVIWKFHP